MIVRVNLKVFLSNLLLKLNVIYIHYVNIFVIYCKAGLYVLNHRQYALLHFSEKQQLHDETGVSQKVNTLLI